MIYAIGDVHGMYDQLLEMLDKIREHTVFRSDFVKVVMVGDYVDRGPKSKEVVEFLSKGFADPNIGFVSLMGNHERMMIDAFNGEAQWLSTWLGNGGRQTLQSYGVSPFEDINTVLDHMNDLKKEYRDHFTWMRKLPLYHVHDNYIFVHAGIMPDINMRDQQEGVLLWIRDRFLYQTKPHPDKIVVHGHTPTCFDPLNECNTSTPFLLPTFEEGRINIDTGACFNGGRLTAVGLPEKGEDMPVEFFFVDK